MLVCFVSECFVRVGMCVGMCVCVCVCVGVRVCVRVFASCVLALAGGIEFQRG